MKRPAIKPSARIAWQQAMSRSKQRRDAAKVDAVTLLASKFDEEAYALALKNSMKETYTGIVNYSFRMHPKVGA